MRILPLIFAELDVNEVVILTSNDIERISSLSRFDLVYVDSISYVKAMIILKSGIEIPASIGVMISETIYLIVAAKYENLEKRIKFIENTDILFIISKKDISLSEYAKLKLKHDSIRGFNYD